MKPFVLTGKKRHGRFLILMLSLVLIFFTLSVRGLIVSIIGPVARPFVSLGTWIADKTFFWSTSQNISAEALKELYEQRETLAVDREEYEQLKQENEQLKQELNFIERTSLASIPAAIISKSISGVVSRFVIDVGTDAGVEEGSPVVVGEGLFVGKVTTVGKHTSTITSITDPTHATAVSLLNEHRTIGVATGETGDLLRIQFIPMDEDIHKNDLVVTSGLETSIPSGLLVGIVNTVRQETGSPFQEAIVEPLADIRRISSVLVLIQESLHPVE